MDFSWFGITVVDIGIVSVGVIGFAWLFRRIAVLERENGVLHARANATEKENGRLQAEISKLQAEISRLQQENQELAKRFEILEGRYAEIKEVLTLILKRENFSS